MKDQIKAHIQNGETEEAIKLLIQFAQTKNKSFQHKTKLISSQYRRWKKEKILGINEDSSRELARIEHSLLELVDHEEDALTFKAENSKSNKALIYILGGLAVVAAIVAAIMFSQNAPDTNEPSPPVTPDGVIPDTTKDTIPEPDTPKVNTVTIPEKKNYFKEKERWLWGKQATFGWKVNETQFATGDVNDDGKDDLILLKKDGVHVAIAGFNGFTNPTIWSREFKTGKDWDPKKDVRMIGDANGDGNADIIGMNREGTFVALSNGENGFGPPELWTEDYSKNDGWYDCNNCKHYARTIAYVNKDKYVDIVGFHDGAVWVSYSNGSSFPRRKARLNDELVVRRGGWEGFHLRTVADVNGDNLGDFIGFGIKVQVALNIGIGFQNLTSWGNEFTTSGWNKNKHERYLGKIDDDNRMDIIGFNETGVHVALSHKEENKFEKSELWLEDFGNEHGWGGPDKKRLIGDFNGDGKVDLAGITDEAVYVYLTD